MGIYGETTASNNVSFDLEIFVAGGQDGKPRGRRTMHGSLEV